MKFTNNKIEDEIYNQIHEELIRFSNNYKFLKMFISDEYEILNWKLENDKYDFENLYD